MERLVLEHPKIFHRGWPDSTASLPEGWCGLVSSFCTFLESTCSDEQLGSLVFDEICERDSGLVLRYRFEVPLRKEQIDIVGARAFAIQNRSAVSCVVCGRMVAQLPEVGDQMLCHGERCTSSRNVSVSSVDL
jgi:hypothetical protein